MATSDEITREDAARAEWWEFVGIPSGQEPPTSRESLLATAAWIDKQRVLAGRPLLNRCACGYPIPDEACECSACVLRAPFPTSEVT